MGVDGIDSPSIAKTLRSLKAALGSLEHEIEFVLGRARAGSGRVVLDFARKLAASVSPEMLLALARGIGALQPRIGMPDLRALTGLTGLTGIGLDAGRAGLSSLSDLAKLFTDLASRVDVRSITGALAGFIGAADVRALESLRVEVLAMLDDLSGVHEREIALSGGLSQLRTRATRFDEALIGLARVQGRMVARLEAQTVRADEVEKLAGRRDDHITRLIRDTAAQRGEIERLARHVGEVDQRDADFRRRLELVEVGADENDRLVRVESQVSDLKRLQKTGIQSAIESLDGLRDRVGRLEARAAEMSREARAKSGRLDALARHVASVEGRLTTAIGKGGGNVVTVAARKIEDFEGADESRRALGTS
jgi:hypothetical protein